MHLFKLCLLLAIVCARKGVNRGFQKAVSHARTHFFFIVRPWYYTDGENLSHVNVAAHTHEKTQHDGKSYLKAKDFVHQFGYWNVTPIDISGLTWDCSPSVLDHMLDFNSFNLLF